MTNNCPTNYLVSHVGFLRDTIGRFGFRGGPNVVYGGHNKVHVVNVTEISGQGQELAARKLAQRTDHFDRRSVFELIYLDYGVIANIRYLPAEWSKPVADSGTAPSGENFLSQLKKYCYWLVFLPGIEENGRPAKGFDLSLAQASPKEVNGFLGGLSTEFKSILHGVTDRMVFVNPSFIESFRQPDLSWAMFFGYTLGRVRANLLLKGINGLKETNLSEESRQLIIEAFALKYQYLVASGYVKGVERQRVVDLKESGSLRYDLRLLANGLGNPLAGLSDIGKTIFSVIEKQAGLQTVGKNGQKS